MALDLWGSPQPITIPTPAETVAQPDVAQPVEPEPPSPTIAVTSPEPTGQPGPDPVTIPIPGEQKGPTKMAASDRCAESMELVTVTQAQGHAFCMEMMRHNSNSQVIGAREALSHRIIGESGGGQARAQLPGGMGGVPTVVPKA